MNTAFESSCPLRAHLRISVSVARVVAAVAWAACQVANAAPTLLADCRADASDRVAYRAGGDGRGNGAAWEEVAKRDAQRDQRVLQALKQHRLRSSQDYLCASNILLHSGDEPTLRLSFALAVQGQALFPAEPAFAGAAARAWDRLMMARQQPQWFATQFDSPATGNAGFRLYPLATGLMGEAERARLGGLTDAEVQAKLAKLNTPRAAADAATTPPAAASPGRRYRLRADPDLLISALDTDLGLANVLAQLRQDGVQALVSGEGQSTGLVIFIPRSAAALRTYFQDEVPRIPRAEGSATPTSASAANIRLESQDGLVRRLIVGIDDHVQAAATLAVRPDRFFELLVDDTGSDDAPLALTRIQRKQ